MSSLSVGIVGLPNAGKSTLFNALLKRQIAQVAEYPFTTIEPNTGVVEVPDERLTKLCELIKPEKCVPSAIEFVDIAGLVKGAAEGEGLGNQFLAHIREVDAILHLVRLFENEKVVHVMGRIDPEKDIEVVNQELEAAGIKKPTLYVLNVDETQLATVKSALRSDTAQTDFPTQASLRDTAPPTAGPRENLLRGIPPRALIILICAKLEAELGELAPEEQKEYLREFGVTESGLDKVIRESYKLLDLMTFYTIKGGKQVQAWPLKRGAKMIEAARLVHTDFAQKFIKAEVISWDKLVAVGGWLAAREKGLIKIAGKEEVVNDGEVIEFKI